MKNGQVEQVEGLNARDSVLLEGSRFFQTDTPVYLDVGSDNRKRRYVQFGQPEIIDEAVLVEAGTYEGVTFYRRRDDPVPPKRVYARYLDRCTLQGFEFISGIRG